MHTRLWPLHHFPLFPTSAHISLHSNHIIPLSPQKNVLLPHPPKAWLPPNSVGISVSLSLVCRLLDGIYAPGISLVPAVSGGQAGICESCRESNCLCKHRMLLCLQVTMETGGHEPKVVKRSIATFKLKKSTGGKGHLKCPGGPHSTHRPRVWLNEMVDNEMVEIYYSARNINISPWVDFPH